MNSATPTLSDSPTGERSRSALLADLFKARLTGLVLLTTLAGYYLGQRTGVDFYLLTHTLAGTGLLACGAAALNQYLERDLDAQMRRTATRPLPAGELKPLTVLFMGASLSILGLVWLTLKVNLITGFLGAVTLASYVFVYTPLKRLTPLNTVVGAVPGALPPLMGWTAARGEVTIEGWSLFAILFFWQLPHFLAIAWLYREEYERAGFKMLPAVDPDGTRTGSQAVCHTFGLLPVSLSPFVFQLAGEVYLVGALLLGIMFLWTAKRFEQELTRASARRLFFVSIIYLPLLLGLLVLDKI